MVTLNVPLQIPATTPALHNAVEVPFLYSPIESPLVDFDGADHAPATIVEALAVLGRLEKVTVNMKSDQFDKIYLDHITNT